MKIFLRGVRPNCHTNNYEQVSADSDVGNLDRWAPFEKFDWIKKAEIFQNILLLSLISVYEVLSFQIKSIYLSVRSCVL